MTEFRYRPLRDVVFVRIRRKEEKSPSGLILPEDQRDLYDDRNAPHNIVLPAEVLAVGPDVDPMIVVGERVFIKRLDFMWIEKEPDGSYVGQLPGPNVLGLVEED